MANLNRICAGLLLGCLVAAGQSGDPAARPPREIQQQLAKKYPKQAMVNWCGGRFLGKPANAVAVVHDAAKKTFLVVWISPAGEAQELDSVAQSGADSKFELQCLDASQAKEREDVLQHSEAIESSLQVPTGEGAARYFTDTTTAKCWSLDRTSGKLKEVGGWIT